MENSYFKQQLLLKLKCEEITVNELNRLNYYKRDLERIFIKYNKSVNFNYTNYQPKQKRDLFNLTIRPGVNYSNFEIINSFLTSKSTKFGSNIGARLGMEMELILPFNKNKWGIIVEPTYQYYKSEQSEELSMLSGGILISKVDYKSFELPIGVRHYFYLNNESKLFANVSFVFDYSIKSTMEFFRQDGSKVDEFNVKSESNFAFGLGYKYKNRFGVEIRYYTDREILYHYGVKSKYSSLNVIFGITLF